MHENFYYTSDMPFIKYSECFFTPFLLYWFVKWRRSGIDGGIEELSKRVGKIDKKSWEDSFSRSLVWNGLFMRKSLDKMNEGEQSSECELCRAYSLATACCWRMLQISRYFWYLDLRIWSEILFIYSIFVLFPENTLRIWFIAL